MITDSNSFLKVIGSLLMFPLTFQGAFLAFAWGSGDPFWIMTAKRGLALLPVLAIILGCWLSIACMITVVVRPQRREFVTKLFITWWDLGKAIVAFWGGIVRFVFHLVAALFGAVKIVVMGLWALVQDVVLMPFRLVRNAGLRVLTSDVPWIAVSLTLFWCFIEAVIFTYVTTPLVIDTFSNITGENLTVAFVRIPLFIFLFFVVLGSYAVLSTFLDAARSKNISAIVGIGVIEIIVLMVEVVFLYREFVDSLVPWMAQYSEDFELGIFGTLAISTFVWFGIRSLSWFLFASHGTPTIMSVIQGKGIQVPEVKSGEKPRRSRFLEISTNFVEQLRGDATWIQEQGERLLASFMLPPLQVVAAAINFCTLLIAGEHLFTVPFRSLSDIADSRTLLNNLFRREAPFRDAA
ncbi:MAG: hypothetical protein D6681_03055 [Calditrichaeota bacterium]|nr:MAG: hypothetical protein D6681_03055 [Calditrichota bacterium]